LFIISFSDGFLLFPYSLTLSYILRFRVQTLQRRLCEMLKVVFTNVPKA